MGMVLHLNPITNTHLHQEAMHHPLLIHMLHLLGMPHLMAMDHLLMAMHHRPNLMATTHLSPQVGKARI